MPPVYINARFLTQRITGVQRYAIEIVKELVKINPDVCLVAPPDILHKDLAAELRVKVIGRFKSHLWEQFDLPLYLKSLNSPLLLNLGNTAPVAYANQIVTIHDLSFLVNPAWFSRKFAYFYKFLIPRIARKSRAICTISTFSKNELMGLLGIQEEKIHLISCAISSTLKSEAVPPLGEGISVPGKYVLAVGSIDPRKNLRILIDAFQQQPDKALHLVVVGSVNKVFADDDFKRKAEADPRIVFSNYVSDPQLIQLYRNAELFVYPSLYEGFGMPPLEAMYHGCPVIVSDIPPHREVCGSAAVYADPKSVNSIRQGIEAVLSDATLKNRMLTEGRQRARHFSWTASAGKLNALVKACQSN